MPYLVCSDLDNTLLTKNKKIRLKTKLFIRRFVKNGNYFVLNSGRPLSGALKFYCDLKVKMPLVCSNGSSIYIPQDDGSLQYVPFSIKKEKFIEFLNEIDPYLIAAIENTNGNLYIENSEVIPWFLMHNKVPFAETYTGKLKDILVEDPIQPNIWVCEESLDTVKEIISKYSEYFEPFYWGIFDGRAAIELQAPGISKGSALLYLEKLLNIDHENTYAFGDQLNDIKMLRAARYGIAMINSKDEVIKEASDITKKDYNHNGVVDYLIKNNIK